jgi:hypothetical protein
LTRKHREIENVCREGEETPATKKMLYAVIELFVMGCVEAGEITRAQRGLHEDSLVADQVVSELYEIAAEPADG